MQQIVATVVSIVLVLGLVSYGLVSQVQSVKDTSDLASQKHSKLEMLLNDPDIVTGKTIDDYSKKGISVTVFQTDGITDLGREYESDELFEITKIYGTDGELSSCRFVLVNLGS